MPNSEQAETYQCRYCNKVLPYGSPVQHVSVIDADTLEYVTCREEAWW